MRAHCGEKEFRVAHGLDSFMDWIGLGWIGSEALKIIFEQLNCFSVLLSKSRLELLLTYL